MPHLLWALLAAAALPANATFKVDTAASTIRYTIVHKLHRVEGVSHDMEAKAVVKEDGTVLTMVRVAAASFRSGDGNRDEHMLEAVQAGKFPFAVFKGIAALSATREVPTTAQAMEGQVELHGVATPTKVPVTLVTEPDGSIRVRGSFDVSLDAHGVERPSLLFVKIDDNCHIDFDLKMRSSS